MFCCAGKSIWIHGYRGDGIKAAKSLQHRPVPGQEPIQNADSSEQSSPEVSHTGLPDINVMDSVLSLDGTQGRAHSRAVQEAAANSSSVKELYLKKGLGTLSWVQRAHAAT